MVNFYCGVGMRFAKTFLLAGLLAGLSWQGAAGEERAFEMNAGTHTAALPQSFLPSREAGAPDIRPLAKLQLALLGVLSDRGAVNHAELGARSPLDAEALRESYAARDYRPLWLDAEGLTPRGEALLRALDAADEDGLDPDDYGAEARRAARATDIAAPVALARLELRLSGALLAFLTDLKIGRIEPTSLGADHDIARKRVEPLTLLLGAIAAPNLADYVAAQRPQTLAYTRLRQALRDYRWLATVQADILVPEGPTLRLGEEDPRVPLLRQRLTQLEQVASPLPDAISGFSHALVPAAYMPEPGTLYDPLLERAVMDFQRRHGLEVDGVVGRKTLAALNVTLADRAAQILVNLERLRWQATELGETHVAVNLPDYRMRVVSRGGVLHEARVIIGTPKNRTPLFSDRITYLEFNPFWNVPRSIVGEEILPELRKDPGYLAANDFKLLSDWGGDPSELDPHGIPWEQISAKGFPFRVRQEPGPGNALGLVKFMFPNRHSVYMHDTPAKSLFGKNRRAFSHGCIRVQHPERFAQVLLGWSDEDVQAAMETPERRIVSLAEPIPVHLTYYTAWLAEDGTLQFRDDPYDNDRRLAQALLGESSR